MVIAKVGLDGHTTGAAVVALALRDAGFEVINLGARVTPEQVVAAAQEEDADVIGLSILSGAHLHLVNRVLDALRAADDDRVVVVGGTVPPTDADELIAAGVAGVFGPGSSIHSIVEFIDEKIQERWRARSSS